jgi:hypothetical protein
VSDSWKRVSTTGKTWLMMNYLDANLVVDAGLAVFNVLLQLLQGSGVGGGAICLEDLDIFVRERSNLLLLGLVICKLLLVFLPVLTRGARHGGEGALRMWR